MRSNRQAAGRRTGKSPLTAQRRTPVEGARRCESLRRPPPRASTRSSRSSRRNRSLPCPARHQRPRRSARGERRNLAAASASGDRAAARTRRAPSGGRLCPDAAHSRVSYRLATRSRTPRARRADDGQAQRYPRYPGSGAVGRRRIAGSPDGQCARGIDPQEGERATRRLRRERNCTITAPAGHSPLAMCGAS